MRTCRGLSNQVQNRRVYQFFPSKISENSNLANKLTDIWGYRDSLMSTLMSCGEPHMGCKYSCKCNMNTFSLVFTLYTKGLGTIKVNLLKTQTCDQKPQVSLIILNLQHLLTLHHLLLNYILKSFTLSVVTVKERKAKLVLAHSSCVIFSIWFWKVAEVVGYSAHILCWKCQTAR